MRIYLSRGHTGMSKHGLDGHQVRPLLQEQGRKSVAEAVISDAALYARSSYPLVDDLVGIVDFPAGGKHMVSRFTRLAPEGLGLMG